MMKTLPVILLKGFILLPKEELKIELNNELSRKVIMLSGKSFDNQIVIVSPNDTLEETPDVSDLPKIVVYGTILSKMELPNGHLRVKILGQKRVKIKKYFNDEDDEDILKCNWEEIKTSKIEQALDSALKRKLEGTLKKYIKMNPSLSNMILGLIKEKQSLSEMTDLIVSFMNLGMEKKLAYMQENNSQKRAQNLLKDLDYEIEVLKYDQELNESLQKGLDESQKEFILRERLKEIKKALGEENEKKIETNDWLNKLDNLNLDNKTVLKIKREINKYEQMNDLSPDASFIRNYLETFFALPWHKFSYDENDLDNILTSLNQTHYGLTEIKNRIIEYCAVKKRNPNLRSPIICLVGPPGVGKTTIAMSIAKALNKEFYKISVGGLNDASELCGNRRTYIGSGPGKIMEAMIKCGTNNPVLLIDEVDKMVKDYHSDPASVLLDVLDYPQNQTFIDHYIEEPFDLSNVLFILTANDLTKIPVELKDRLEIIEVSSYTLYEKINLAKEYLLPKIYEEYGISNDELTIPDGVISSIINHYTKEAGVRDLKRKLETLVRKILTKSIKSKKKLALSLNEKDLKKYLDVFLYEEYNLPKTQEAGLVNALAWTSVGGRVLPIESCLFKGSGKLEMSGSLKEVMKESITVAMDYLKSHYEEANCFENYDIHLHAIDGSTPKDGPSAGVAIVTSLLSLMTQKNILNTIAFTGEITLRGDILPVGGIKEKLIGAFNNGIHTVYLPKENSQDLKKVPEYVLDNLEIILVSNYKEIYKKLFKEKK